MTKRPLLAAILAGGLLLTAACGNDTAGTGTSESTTSSVASTTEETSQNAPEVTSSETEDTSSEETTSTSETSTEESTTDESTTTSSEETSTRTIGADVTSLDATSTEWFSQMCVSLEPLVTLTDDLQAQASDPAKLLGTLRATGEGFSDAAENLAGVPAPTFEGGEEMATTMVDGLQQLGDKFQEAAGQLEKGDMGALTTMQDALKSNPMTAMGEVQINPALQEEIRNLPACQVLN